MFGFCQNVQIIQMHHHHFYQLRATDRASNAAALSRKVKPVPMFIDRASFGENADPIRQTHSSMFYHTKRSYLHKNNKGIEVISKKLNQSFSQQRHLLQNGKLNQPNQAAIRYHHCEPSQLYWSPSIQVQRVANTLNFAPHPHLHSHELHQKNQPRRPQRQIQIQRIEKSNPPTKIKLPSHISSSRTKKIYMNCHQLQQSKLGYADDSIYQTLKINRQDSNKPDSNSYLKILLENKSPKRRSQSHHQGSSLIQSIHNEKDSVLTKKNQIPSTLKTPCLMYDAKSIVSRQSLENELINIEESIIISRSMDYFCHLTAEKQLFYCKIYLAKDNNINWLVAIRLFEQSNEQVSLQESYLYNHLAMISQMQKVQFGILSLYKVLVEGTGRHKSIIFVLEPYEIILDQLLLRNKGQFRAFAPSLSLFLRQFEDQLNDLLIRLQDYGFSLVEQLELSDLVLTNGKYKLHSVIKFQANSNIKHIAVPKIIQNLKSSIIKTVLDS